MLLSKAWWLDVPSRCSSVMTSASKYESKVSHNKIYMFQSMICTFTSRSKHWRYHQYLWCFGWCHVVICIFLLHLFSSCSSSFSSSFVSSFATKWTILRWGEQRCLRCLRGCKVRFFVGSRRWWWWRSVSRMNMTTGSVSCVRARSAVKFRYNWVYIRTLIFEWYSCCVSERFEWYSSDAIEIWSVKWLEFSFAHEH